MWVMSYQMLLIQFFVFALSLPQWIYLPCTCNSTSFVWKRDKTVRVYISDIVITPRIAKTVSNTNARHALGQGWPNSGPLAKCGPPQRFQWPAEAFTKIFKCKISSNSTQQTLVLRLTRTEICFYFQKLWPSADRGLLKMAPEPK